MPPVCGSVVRICGMMQMQHFWIRTSSTAAASTLVLHSTSSDRILFDLQEVAGMANVKIYLLCQFCSNLVKFFTTHRRHSRKKMMDQNFEIRILWFLRIFLKFSKRRHSVPLWPIRTIIVAAKLHQSRVLVTKFRQNRLTLKGRSAGQSHTDRQTHRQTRLKIMAPQVCNLANRTASDLQYSVSVFINWNWQC